MLFVLYLFSSATFSPPPPQTFCLVAAFITLLISAKKVLTFFFQANLVCLKVWYIHIDLKIKTHREERADKTTDFGRKKKLDFLVLSSNSRG